LILYCPRRSDRILSRKLPVLFVIYGINNAERTTRLGCKDDCRNRRHLKTVNWACINTWIVLAEQWEGRDKRKLSRCASFQFHFIHIRTRIRTHLILWTLKKLFISWPYLFMAVSYFYLGFFSNIEGQDQFGCSFHEGVETVPSAVSPDVIFLLLFEVVLRLLF
jgi:hypothetical protein